MSYPLIEHYTDKGNSTKKIVPTPGSDSHQIRPPCRSIISLEIVSPRPRPDVVRNVRQEHDNRFQKYGEAHREQCHNHDPAPVTEHTDHRDSHIARQVYPQTNISS